MTKMTREDAARLPYSMRKRMGLTSAAEDAKEQALADIKSGKTDQIIAEAKASMMQPPRKPLPRRAETTSRPARKPAPKRKTNGFFGKYDFSFNVEGFTKGFESLIRGLAFMMLAGGRGVLNLLLSVVGVKIPPSKLEQTLREQFFRERIEAMQATEAKNAEAATRFAEKTPRKLKPIWDATIDPFDLAEEIEATNHKEDDLFPSIAKIRHEKDLYLAAYYMRGIKSPLIMGATLGVIHDHEREIDLDRKDYTAADKALAFWIKDHLQSNDARWTTGRSSILADLNYKHKVHKACSSGNFPVRDVLVDLFNEQRKHLDDFAIDYLTKFGEKEAKRLEAEARETRATLNATHAFVESDDTEEETMRR